MKSLAVLLAVGALIASMIVIGVSSARRMSVTYDEPVHFRYGQNILAGDSNRWIDGTMPMSALNAIPYKIGSALGTGAGRNALMDVQTGRKMTMLFSVLVALYVFHWARRLYGPLAGLLSLLVYAFSPNTIAHSRVITTDVYAAGMILIATYYFWTFLNLGGWKRAAVSAVALGVAQLAKYPCIFLYPVFALILALRCLPDVVARARRREPVGLRRRAVAFLRFAAFFVAVSLVIINVGFVLNAPFTPLERYEFKSDLFKAVQAKASFVGKIPLPLPYPFLDGLDRGRFREETGRGFGKMYLFGELREVGGFRGYYLFAFLFKVPLATQVLILLAIVYCLRRRSPSAFLRNEVFLVVPILFFTIYLNWFFKLQIGIRHYLVVFPLLHIFCASPLRHWREYRPGIKALYAGLAVYLVVSVLSYHPHYISYFNELVPDRKQAYKILADSNIDWGQDMEYLEQYLSDNPDVRVIDFDRGLWFMKKHREKHKEAYLHPDVPDSGRLIVNVNNLVGIYHPHRYAWLRDARRPVERVAGSYLVFEIEPGDAARAESLFAQMAEEGTSLADTSGAGLWAPDSAGPARSGGRVEHP